eukprot:m51a1_g12199 hypothetical protein (252) ;mRNA; f:49061-49816
MLLVALAAILLARPAAAAAAATSAVLASVPPLPACLALPVPPGVLAVAVRSSGPSALSASLSPGPSAASPALATSLSPGPSDALPALAASLSPSPDCSQPPACSSEAGAALACVLSRSSRASRERCYVVVTSPAAARVSVALLGPLDAHKPSDDGDDGDGDEGSGGWLSYAVVAVCVGLSLAMCCCLLACLVRLLAGAGARASRAPGRYYDIYIVPDSAELASPGDPAGRGLLSAAREDEEDRSAGYDRID